MRHHIGATQDAKHRLLTIVEFEGLDVDTRIGVGVARPAQLADHLGVQPGGQVPRSVGGTQKVCSGIELVPLGQ